MVRFSTKSLGLPWFCEFHTFITSSRNFKHLFANSLREALSHNRMCSRYAFLLWMWIWIPPEYTCIHCFNLLLLLHQSLGQMPVSPQYMHFVACLSINLATAWVPCCCHQFPLTKFTNSFWLTTVLTIFETNVTGHKFSSPHTLPPQSDTLILEVHEKYVYIIAYASMGCASHSHNIEFTQWKDYHIH